MVFVEERKKGDKTQYYLAKAIRVDGKVKKKRVFLGTDLNKTQLEKKMADAKVILGEIDFDSILTKKEVKEFEEIKKNLNKGISRFDAENFYEHFITEFTYDSNAIEGSTLTLGETALVLFEDLSPQGKPIKYMIEAKNHKEAYDFITKSKRKKISQKLICDIQKKVVENTLPKHLEQGVGSLRLVNVRVGSHIAPQFYSVPRMLGALIKWFNSSCEKHNPIVVAAYFHSEFERIHPFVDGNGRTGRLLMNFMLVNAGYPPLTIFFKYRVQYYKALEQSQKKKNFKPLIKIMKSSYKDMLKQYSEMEN